MRAYTLLFTLLAPAVLAGCFEDDPGQVVIRAVDNRSDTPVSILVQVRWSSQVPDEAGLWLNDAPAHSYIAADAIRGDFIWECPQQPVTVTLRALESTMQGAWSYDTWSIRGEVEDWCDGQPRVVLFDSSLNVTAHVA